MWAGWEAKKKESQIINNIYIFAHRNHPSIATWRNVYMIQAD